MSDLLIHVPRLLRNGASVQCAAEAVRELYWLYRLTVRPQRETSDLFSRCCAPVAPQRRTPSNGSARTTADARRSVSVGGARLGASGDFAQRPKCGLRAQ